MSAVLLDTCAAIFLASGDPLPPPALAALEQALAGDGILFSPISAWEIGLISRPGRAKTRQFLPDPKGWVMNFLDQPGIRLVPLSPEIAVESAYLPPEFHNDPGDRMLIATARALNVPLITRDKAILEYSAAGHLRTIAC